MASDALARFGTRDPEAIRLASENTDHHQPPAHLLFDEEAFQFFDPVTGRQIYEEEILSWRAGEVSSPPEPVGFDALLDFTLPPGSLLDEDFTLEPLFGPPDPPSLLADIEAAKQRAAELNAAEEEERAAAQAPSGPPVVIFSRQQAEEMNRQEQRREIERLEAEGVIVPVEPESFDLMLEGGLAVLMGPLGRPIAKGVATGVSKTRGFFRRLWRRFRGLKDEATDAARGATKQADEVGEAGKKLATKKSESAPARRNTKQRKETTTRPPPNVRGPYSHLDDPPSVGPRKDFTATQKAKIIEANKARNGGVVRSDLSGKELKRPGKSKKGVAPSLDEWQIDHMTPKNKGGTNSYSNAQVVSRAEKRLKSSK